MNDYLGNLVARSRDASAALRPQFAHPYESLGNPSGPVAAPFPEVATPEVAAPEDGTPWMEAGARGEARSSSVRAERAGEAAPQGLNEAADEKSSAGRAAPGPSAETTSKTTSQTASDAPSRPPDPAAVRARPREDSTPGEPPTPGGLIRPLPTADATGARPHRFSPREEHAGTGEATGQAPAPRSHTPARGDEAQQRRASVVPASPYVTPPDARQTRAPEATPSHAAPGLEAAAPLPRVEPSLIPSESSPVPLSPDSPAEGRRPAGAAPGVPAPQDARALRIQGRPVPAAPDLKRAAAPDPPAPTIRVTIGRVEVRAVTPTPAPSRKPARPAPRMSLDEYLRAQNGGRG